MAKIYAQNGENRIYVVVRGEGVSGASEGSKGNKTTSTEDTNTGGSSSGSSSDSSWKTKIYGTDNKERQKKILKTNLVHAMAVSKQIVGLGVEYYLGGLSYSSGDKAYQESQQRLYEEFEDTFNVATSVVQGMTYGSFAGPLGTVAGAIFGGLTTAVSTTFKYANAKRENDVKVAKENNSIEYQRARAGINWVNGRLR